MATALMQRHGLHDWALVFDRAKTRAGVCRPQRREIGLSLPLTRLHTEAEVRDTVLHEIAHALVGAGHGHDRVWQAAARSIGASGQRCVSPESARVDGAWLGRCGAGHEVTRHQRPARVVTCSRCSSTFDLAHLLTWTCRGQRAPMHPNYDAELAQLRQQARGLAPPQAWARGGAGIDENAGDGANRLWLGPGDSVVITAPGPYAGVAGTVVKRGRTRYHVRVPDAVLTVPFALTAPG